MATVVLALGGETLCGIAVQAGFRNCDLLRAHPANGALLNRPLQLGDRVAVPDRRIKTLTVPTTTRHRLKRDRHASERIRFVHGSAATPFDRDPALTVLNVSNYITNQAGATGSAAFGSGFGFDADADADPDTFKVELTTLDGGGTVKVRLEALRPAYGSNDTIDHYELFTGAEYAARMLDVDAQPVRPGKTAYRSRYLRVVTDDQDQVAAPTQALLVTDLADGLNGSADRLEILDQVVRASYQHPGCKAAAPNQCTLRTELPVGENKLRLRIAMHVFRATVGGAAVGGVTEQMVRRRAMKWFRRAYASANMSVKFVGPAVEFIDPPDASMLTISQGTGATAAGTDASGRQSAIVFRLAGPPAKPFDRIHRAFDPTVKVPLTAGMTPAQAAAAVVAALPRGYSGVASVNAQAFNAANASADVMITKRDGSRVMIRAETTTDPRMTVHVARVDLTKVDDNDTFNTMMASTIEFRRVLRSAPGTDDRLDFYIINSFQTAGLRGRAFVPGAALAAPFAPPQQLRWAIVMATTSSSGAVMDGGDNLPFTFPHEAGHVINDAFHSLNTDPNGPTQLMSGTGTSPTHAVGATKRISDGPYTVVYAMFDPAQPTAGATVNQGIFPVQQMRTNGAPVTEGW